MNELFSLLLFSTGKHNYYNRIRVLTYTTPKVGLQFSIFLLLMGADESLNRPTSRCILFDGENISFDASLVIYIVLIFLHL
jgi:hypothetical protein